jgi:hypothetical protein
MKESYTEVRCDYLDEEEHYWCVDAWDSNEPDAQGRVIAVIHDPDGDIHYCEVEARLSPMAQEVIKAKIAELKSKQN